MRVGWDQVFAWRMRRQFAQPPGDVGVEEVVSRLGGVQAQVASSAELAVGLRQRTPEPGAVARGLADGTLVRTWAMRGTLHLLHAAEAASFLSLLAAGRTWEKPAWQRSFGASPEEVAALAESVSELLDGRILTREELVSELAADPRFAAMEQQLRSGWAALLKPLAWQGVLCHGPSQGTRVTFARPDTMVPGWRGLPAAEEAAAVAIPAYLGAHGPATPEVFDAWLSRNGLRKSTLRAWFAELGDRLVPVDVEGWQAQMLAEHAEELARTEPTTSVRLLGGFDQYVLGPGTGDTRLLPAEHRSRVSRAGGWISPVVVIGGRVAGVWELAEDRIEVSLFPGVEQPPREVLEAEADHVARACGQEELTVRVS